MNSQFEALEPIPESTSREAKICVPYRPVPKVTHCLLSLSREMLIYCKCSSFAPQLLFYLSDFRPIVPSGLSTYKEQRRVVLA